MADTAKPAAAEPAKAEAKAESKPAGRSGGVAIKTPGGALLVGEAAVYHSLKSAADEIARWISTSALLPENGRILLTQHDMRQESIEARVLSAQLEALERITAQQEKRNGELLAPPPASKSAGQDVTGAADVHDTRLLGALLPGAGAIASLLAAVPDALAAAPKLLGSVEGSASLLRADYEAASAAITASDRAFRALVAEQLAKRVAVFLPDEAVVETSALLDRLLRLHEAGQIRLRAQREALARLHAAPRLAVIDKTDKELAGKRAEFDAMAKLLEQLSAALLSAKVDGKNDAPIGEEIARRQTDRKKLLDDIKALAQTSRETQLAVTPVQAAVQATDTLIQQIDEQLKPLRQGDAARLGPALRFEWMKARGITHVLRLNTVTGSHETLTSKPGLLALFGKPSIVCVGHCVVTYQLQDLDGRSVASDAISRTSSLVLHPDSGRFALVDSTKTA